MKQPKFTIQVLGETYKVYEDNYLEDKKLEKNEGYCDSWNKRIVIDETLIKNFKKHVLTHEIVHAFLAESGLRDQSKWGENEEIVDWIALQLFKMETVATDAWKVMSKKEKHNENQEHGNSEDDLPKNS